MSGDEPFEIVLAHLDGFVRIKLRGDFDYPANRVQAETLKEVTALRNRVVVDLADLRFVDSAGLHFLVTLAEAHEGALRLENVPPIISRILAISGLTEAFDLGAASD